MVSNSFTTTECSVMKDQNMVNTRDIMTILQNQGAQEKAQDYISQLEILLESIRVQETRRGAISYSKSYPLQI